MGHRGLGGVDHHLLPKVTFLAPFKDAESRCDHGFTRRQAEGIKKVKLFVVWPLGLIVLVGLKFYNIESRVPWNYCFPFTFLLLEGNYIWIVSVSSCQHGDVMTSASLGVNRLVGDKVPVLVARVS